MKFRVHWLVLLIAALVIAGLFGQMQGQGKRARFPSSYAAEPEGMLAAYRLLTSLGVPVERMALRPEAWVEDDPDAVLVLTTPMRRAWGDRDREAMDAWIRGGGRLVVFNDATGAEDVGALEPWLDSIGLGYVAPLGTPDPKTLLPSRPDLADSRVTRALGLDPLPARVRLHESGRHIETHRGVPLAIDVKGAATAASIELERGEVVQVLGSPLARDRLTDDDALRFGLAILERLRDGGTVVFDEFHHGYGSMLGSTDYWKRLPKGLLLGTFALTAIVFGLSRGVPFGPRRPIPEPERRRDVEFSRSLATLYRRAGRRKHVLQTLMEDVRGFWDARGVPRGAWKDGRAFPRVARETGLHVDDVKKIWTAAVEASNRPDPNEKNLVRQARALGRLRKETA